MTQEDALIVISHIKVLSIVPNRCLRPLDKTFSLYNWIFLSKVYSFAGELPQNQSCATSVEYS